MKQPWYSILSGVAALVSAAALVVAVPSATVLDDRASTVKPATPAARSAITARLQASCPNADTVPLPRSAFPADTGGTASYIQNKTSIPAAVLCLVNAERAAQGIPAPISTPGSGGRLPASAGCRPARERGCKPPRWGPAWTRTSIRIQVRRRHRASQPRATVAAQKPSSSSGRTPTRAGARPVTRRAPPSTFGCTATATEQPSSIPNSRRPPSPWLWGARTRRTRPTPRPLPTSRPSERAAADGTPVNGTVRQGATLPLFSGPSSSCPLCKCPLGVTSVAEVHDVGFFRCGNCDEVFTMPRTIVRAPVTDPRSRPSRVQ